MSIKNFFGLCFLIWFGCSCQSNAPQKRNQTVGDHYFDGDSLRRNAIYYGGTIITMEGDTADTSKEAVVVQNGIITFVGKKDSAFKYFPAPTYVRVDLKGSTLLPGFVDGHGHFSQVAYQIGSADLLPPDQPGGEGIASIYELNERMREFIRDNPAQKQYLGMNYDNTQFTGSKAHPTKHDLDSLSNGDTTVRIVVIHQSGHVGTVNSAMLETKTMKNVLAQQLAGTFKGGYMQLKDGVPTGYLEENALMAVMAELKPFPQSEMFVLFDKTAKKYAENGFTTVQDGRTMPSNWSYLKQYDFAKKLKLDVVAYPDMLETWAVDSHAFAMISKQYVAGSRLRTGGIKFSLDGSPQGKTAWFKENYKNDSTNGYPIFRDQNTLQQLITRGLKNNWQILAHCNGDSAVAQLLDIFSRIKNQKMNIIPQDHRTTLIHAQFITQQQVHDAKTLGMSISTYPLHTFYWGDVHAENLGLDRANRMSPTRWMVNEKVNFSIHTDAPVIFPRSMPLFMTAVRRITRAGAVYGNEHCLKPYEALQAMTIGPAYQHFEENSKGSIKVGKVADFVILSENPLKYSSKPLHEKYNFDAIKIWETIKNGIPVYQNKNSTVIQVTPTVLPGSIKPESRKFGVGCG
ncbi:MAG: hypothetical protein RLZZ628_1602 [Bacteroidota bacterium]|jgi:predicted amidohydrolase YtcJ